MNITYLDADSREVIEVVDDPASTICQVGAEQFAARLGATVVKIVPTPDENEWRIELKIPTAVRRLHMPLSGDPVRFTIKMGVLEHEVSGVYQFRRGHSCVILDDAGGEWEVQSMWQMKKL
jgi:hypothetical protein